MTTKIEKQKIMQAIFDGFAKENPDLLKDIEELSMKLAAFNVKWGFKLDPESLLTPPKEAQGEEECDDECRNKELADALTQPLEAQKEEGSVKCADCNQIHWCKPSPGLRNSPTATVSDAKTSKNAPEEWEKEFERLMPKTARETMTYPQFCAVRNFLRTNLISRKELREKIEGLSMEDKGTITPFGEGAEWAIKKILSLLDKEL